MPINEYLKQVKQLHNAGNPTEHSYRPYLKTLLEQMVEICHYQKIFVALVETDRIMKQIDETIEF